MAGGAVQVNRSKHATRKAVKVCRRNVRVLSQALVLLAIALLAVQVYLKVLLRLAWSRYR